MLVTRILTTNVRRFSTLYRKPVPKQLFIKVKPLVPMRSMSSNLEMKPMNAMLWFVGMAIPIVVVAWSAGSQILGRFDKADAGEYGPPMKRISNDQWLELKEKVLAMADSDEDEEDEESEGETEAASETASTVAEAIEEEDFVMIAEEGVAEQVSQEVGKDTIIFVAPPKSE